MWLNQAAAALKPQMTESGPEGGVRTAPSRAPLCAGARCLCLPALSIARSVAARCTRFVFCTMTSFGLQGESFPGDFL